jgi:hypothetical protein
MLEPLTPLGVMKFSSERRRFSQSPSVSDLRSNPAKLSSQRARVSGVDSGASLISWAASDAASTKRFSGKLGRIEWAGGSDLTVYTNRRRLFEKLWAIPGVKRHQTGDTEMRALFPPEALEQIAGVIRAKRKRSGPSPNSLANLRPRAGSGIQNRRSRPELGQRPDGR